jgi:hypothetical protein
MVCVGMTSEGHTIGLGTTNGDESFDDVSVYTVLQHSMTDPVCACVNVYSLYIQLYQSTFCIVVMCKPRTQTYCSKNLGVAD